MLHWHSPIVELQLFPELPPINQAHLESQKIYQNFGKVSLIEKQTKNLMLNLTN